MDNLTSQGDLATRIRVAAGEAGILPGDALAPVLKALAEIPAEVRQSLAPLVQQIEAVKRPVDDDKLRYAVAQGIHGHAASLIRAFNLRTWVGAAGMILAALAIGAGGGYWFGESRGQTQGLSAVSVFAQLQPSDALAWADVIRYNPSGQQELTHCQRIADQDGRAVCQMNIWIDPPAPPRH